MTNDLDGLMSGGGAGPSAFTKNTPLNTTVSGMIISATGMQRRDYVTGDPKVWNDGTPQMQVAVSIQTTLKDGPDDDGVRGVYVKTWGPQRDALLDAVKAAGFSKLSEALVPGAIFTAQFYGTQPSKQGSDEKLFHYRIDPAPNASLETVMGGPAPATPDPWATTASIPATPVPVAPSAAPPAATPAATVKQLRALGMADSLIAQQLGLDESVIPILAAS